MTEIKLQDILIKATQKQASDVHLVSGKSPIFRIHGDLIPCEDIKQLQANDLKIIIFDVLTDRQRTIFTEHKELDFYFSCMEEYQFRVNVHIERGNISATIRITPTRIASMEELGIPPVVEELVKKRKGLIVVSGTAGCGKSTTLNYMVNLINNSRKCKIITIEDPIEFVHESKKSLIVQREVGSDTETFVSALKYALRQDPDVVIVGEMRDLESISMALTTAETGHLVITTVHAPDAIETINRIIDAYPTANKEQILTQLANNLLAVVCQTLVLRSDMERRVLITEILLSTVAVRNLIRRGELVEIRGQLDSEDNVNMYSFERCLSALVEKGIISTETALIHSKYPNLLKLSGKQKLNDLLIKSSSLSHEPEIVIKREDKILIIDEEEQDRAAMQSLLRGQGFDYVSIARNGQEGLIKFKMEKPDIVIIDITINDINGFDLCKNIKRIKDINPYVILITRNLKLSDPKKAEEAEADDFIVKTANWELLTKAIKKIYEK